MQEMLAALRHGEYPRDGNPLARRRFQRDQEHFGRFAKLAGLAIQRKLRWFLSLFGLVLEAKLVAQPFGQTELRLLHLGIWARGAIGAGL